MQVNKENQFEAPTAFIKTTVYEDVKRKKNNKKLQKLLFQQLFAAKRS